MKKTLPPPSSVEKHVAHSDFSQEKAVGAPSPVPPRGDTSALHLSFRALNLQNRRESPTYEGQGSGGTASVPPGEGDRSGST